MFAGDCIYQEDMANRVKLAFNSGFQIASHTWAHKHLPNLTAAQGKWTIAFFLLRLTSGDNPFSSRFRDGIDRGCVFI